jgi:succinyl-CoA synthetase beta subunit
VTYQTGPSGQVVGRLLIEEGLAIDRELYLSMLVDRASQMPVMMISAEGGVDIEEVAAKTPEKIHKEFIDPAIGLMPFQARKLAFAVGLSDQQISKATKMMLALYKAFIASDASLLEINPLIVTKSGDLLALDAKMNLDDNALFRHSDVRDLRDLSEEDPLEVEASEFSLNDIRLDGNIGCMVNGAGLAMTSMDIVKLFGGEPANFLDIGGGAGADKVAAAMRIIVSDPNVKAVLINIFGGITRCDEVARGILVAMDEVKPKVPMVVRLVGTNAEEGRRLLENANMITAETLVDAAKKAVAAAKGK